MIILRFPKDIAKKELIRALAKVKSIHGDVYVINHDRQDFTDVICCSDVDDNELLRRSGALAVIHPQEPYILASRNYQKTATDILSGGSWQRGSTPLIIGGPCSVEDRSQVLEIAHAVRESGADAFRGGAFKPRTSPYSFQGIGNKGYEYLAEVKEQTGLLVISEVMSIKQAHIASEYIDVLQVGARNMQNVPLLNALGKLPRPVLLKRGFSATLEELLLSAEYILRNGNRQVLLCERGIRTFETETRFTFDINAIPVLKEKSHLPVLGDPSHATGRREYVESVSLAAIAAGADGLLIEVDTDPASAKSDGPQTVSIEAFATLVKKVKRVYALIHSMSDSDEL
jgi:3-deoxy-7-phosphoheptulonate synthase